MLNISKGVLCHSEARLQLLKAFDKQLAAQRYSYHPFLKLAGLST
jgi:hypothetical protein